jgi:CRP-like cAMP-binding protein
MSLSLAPADEALLLTAPLFAGIDRDSALLLVDAALPSAHPAGGLLFAQGDPADRFFLVLDGRVDLLALTPTGDQSIIEVIDPGQTFAEAAIFAIGRYPLTAEMAAGTRLLQIPARPFLNRLAERQGLAAKLLASLARWQRRLLNEIADLKGRSPAQRLGLFLLAAAQPLEDGGALVRLPLSKADLASRIGITPESLSRAVVRLRPLGVASRGRDFVLADLAALRQFCGGDD